MDSQRNLTILKITMFTAVGVVVLMSFISMGLVGSNLTIWQQVETVQTLTIIKKNSNMFFITQQLIIALDVVILPFLFFLLFSTFRFYTKGNFIIIVIYTVMLLFRWISSVLFLNGYSSFRQTLEYKYSQLSNQYEVYNGNPACSSEDCSDAITYVSCAKVFIWKQAYNFELAYAIIVFIMGIALAPLSYFINKIDVELGEREGKL